MYQPCVVRTEDRAKSRPHIKVRQISEGFWIDGPLPFAGTEEVLLVMT